MTILTKYHRLYLFVEGEIGIGNRIPEECTILFSGKKSRQKCLRCCPLSGRYGTSLR
ncbi:MAG: hypothetical protein WCU80_02850 [Paludibacteraceae bacterium]|nr:hypothetical protein [Prevotellaceae bacterium]